VSLNLAAGYVAARVAGKGEMLNAGLSGIATAIVLVAFTTAGGEFELNRTDFALYAVILILGLSGGYLRMRRVRRTVAHSGGAA